MWMLDLRSGDPVRVRRDDAPRGAETFATREAAVEDGRQLWDYAQCADYAGVRRVVYRTYVYRGIAPPPDDPDITNPPSRRRPLTLKWRMVVWRANRPGMGTPWDPKIVELLQLAPPQHRSAARIAAKHHARTRKVSASSS